MVDDSADMLATTSFLVEDYQPVAQKYQERLNLS